MFFECICGMAKLSRSLQDPFWTCHIFISQPEARTRPHERENGEGVTSYQMPAKRLLNH